MATKVPTIPDMADQLVQAPGNVMDPEYYLFLKQLVTVVQEQAAHIEILRVAVSEARVDPTTAYPIVPVF